jgi:hypothetical protein
MKQILLFVVLGLSFPVGASAQPAETFDIATYRSPKGWNRQLTESSVQLSTENKTSGAFCTITLFKAVPGGDDARANFNDAWDAIVKGMVEVTTVPTMADPTTDAGWEIISGYAPFDKDGTKAMAMLVTASGSGKMVNALILTNSQDYESAISAFLASLSLKKPDVVQARQAEQPVGPSGLSVTSHYWKQTQNRRDVGGYAGYSSNTYQFFPNGTYKFSQVTFQNYAPKYYLEDEEGIYKIADGTITLTPKKGSYRTYRSTRQDPVLKSGSLPLQTARYRFEFMDLNNNWTLLLSPVDGLETKRDGGFSFWLNGEKRKTYSYNSVSAAGDLLNAAGQVR